MKTKPKKDSYKGVCSACGTRETPLWRLGPEGPKTMCNACGIKWKRKTAGKKKKNKVKTEKADSSDGLLLKRRLSELEEYGSGSENDNWASIENENSSERGIQADDGIDTEEEMKGDLLEEEEIQDGKIPNYLNEQGDLSMPVEEVVGDNDTSIGDGARKKRKVEEINKDQPHMTALKERAFSSFRDSQGRSLTRRRRELEEKAKKKGFNFFDFEFEEDEDLPIKEPPAFNYSGVLRSGNPWAVPGKKSRTIYPSHLGNGEENLQPQVRKDPHASIRKFLTVATFELQKLETEVKVDRERHELLDYIKKLEKEALYKDHIIKSLLRVSSGHTSTSPYNTNGVSPVLIPPDLISNWVAIERLLGMMEQR